MISQSFLSVETLYQIKQLSIYGVYEKINVFCEGKGIIFYVTQLIHFNEKLF